MGSAAETLPDNSPKIAPDYGHHRKAVEVADVLANVVRAHGINMGGYRAANIQIAPVTGAGNPTVNVYFWSEGKGLFVQQHTPLLFAAVGAGLGWEATVECNGRIMFVGLTGTLTGGVDVHVSGYELDHTL